jgi:hypothetical protein
MVVVEAEIEEQLGTAAHPELRELLVCLNACRFTRDQER